MSRVAVRMNEITGVVQRRISSVAVSSERSVVDEALPLIGSFRERGDAARDRVPRRLVPRDQQLVEEHHELVVAERLAFDLGVREHRDDVVAWIVAARRVVVASRYSCISACRRWHSSGGQSVAPGIDASDHW